MVGQTMRSEPIAEIAIDAQGRLCVRPESAEFPFIHRAAMQVGWDAAGRYLFSPPPKDWTPADWFRHILAAARQEYGVALVVTERTSWRGLGPGERDAMLSTGLDAGPLTK